MAASQSPKVPLIVDHDTGFLESLRNEAISDLRAMPPFIAANMNQSMELLQMHKHEVGVLIVGTRLGRNAVLDLVHGSLRFIPGLPVVLMSESETVEFNDEELRKMVIQKIVRKPITYRDLLKQLALTSPIINLTTKRSDQDMAPIELDATKAAESAGEDVYVRVRADRYIKVLKAGYTIGAERLERYLKRGVKSFYKAK